MIKINNKGDFKNLNRFLKNASKINYETILEKYGKEGVMALASNTPYDSGSTAMAWDYEVEKDNNSLSITWSNSNLVNGVPIAIIIQYGHTTRNGGYVYGRDYINPALRPIFDKIAEDIWKEVIG